MARLLITCGPTREPLDPVRYLSNASSGRMGMAIAAEAVARGHSVDLVLGPVEAALPPPGAGVRRVITCAEMLAACRELHPGCDAVIGAAAVCDFRPRAPETSKRARAGAWTLELVPNPDILAELGRTKGGRIHAGFALETAAGAEAMDRARAKLASKALDWIVLNGPEALGAETGRYVLIGRQVPPQDLGLLPKEELARRLLAAVENSLKQSGRPTDQKR